MNVASGEHISSHERRREPDLIALLRSRSRLQRRHEVYS